MVVGKDEVYLAGTHFIERHKREGLRQHRGSEIFLCKKERDEDG